MTRTFAITFDYLCPFARNAHEHVVAALQAGVDWDVTFVPFSLKQSHVQPGEPDVWDRDDRYGLSGLLALATGIAVRDHWPERFLETHLALFAARHDDGRDIRDREVIADVLRGAGIDPDEVWEVIESGAPLSALQKEHTEAVDDHAVFGVPTFIAGDDAVFVRFMHRPDADADVARSTIERTVDLLTGWPQLNEFKHTRIPR